ncbi:nucleoside-diphosphate sugar epimerase/dehydratase, partial [Kineococcus gypseus]|uniref:nucleoside-diphosphate sugar epimerase/dehydratase n=1 Tax=Kineococcus gypseus TaxID=1637102 RepID=UPI003D7ECCD1
MAAEELETLQQRRVIDGATRGASTPTLPLPRRRAGSVPARRPSRRAEWQRRYVRTLVLSDALAAAIGAVLGWTVRFGDSAPQLGSGMAVGWLVVLLPSIWVSANALMRAYEPRFLGVGSEEFQRVLMAGTTVVALVGTFSWAFALDVARGFVVVALPVAGALTVAGRLAARHRLHRSRAVGRCVQSTLVAGHPSSIAALVRQVRRDTSHGLRIDAACTPGGPGAPGAQQLAALGVPVLGSLEDVASVARRADVDVVATLSCPELDGPVLRALAWQLEDTRADLVVAPALTDVAGPRVVIRPV